MKLKLPIRWNPSESAVLSLVFGAIFLTGLGIFSLSASVIVSSAFLAVSALAAYVIARQRYSAIKPSPTPEPDPVETLARRLLSVETSVKGIENRFARMEASVEAQVVRQMEPLIASVQIMASILEQQNRPAAPVHQREPEEKPHLRPEAPVPLPEPTNPLHKRRIEAVIREGLQSGRLQTSTQDIIALPTARPVYRLLRARLDGLFDQSFGEAELRSAAMPANIIRLFDRVRFAHAFEAATRSALPADGPTIVCPLTFETLEDPIAGAEITELFRQKPALARKFCFLVQEDTLFFDFGLVGQNVRGLINAGCRFALELARDIKIDPFVLQNHGVSLLLAPASLVLAARDRKIHTDIDPVDLVHLLDRRDIDLAISTIRSDGDLRAIRALGMNLILRSPEATRSEASVRLKPEPERPTPKMPRVTEGLEVLHSTEPAEVQPLRARLRRMSA